MDEGIMLVGLDAHKKAVSVAMLLPLSIVGFRRRLAARPPLPRVPERSGSARAAWTGLILSLLQGGPLRFSELEERTRGVGAKTLSARLKELEARPARRAACPGWPPRTGAVHPDLQGARLRACGRCDRTLGP
jgi:hypothetical protein